MTVSKYVWTDNIVHDTFVRNTLYSARKQNT